MDSEATTIYARSCVTSWPTMYGETTATMFVHAHTVLYSYPDHPWLPDVIQFKELNQKLKREVTEYERSVSAGTHYLSGGAGFHEPPSDLEAEVVIQTAHVLGGGSGATTVHSKEEQRRRILEAATSRLRREEEELEQSCGTSGPE